MKGDRKQARKARKDARRPQESAPIPLPTADELAAVNARPIDTRRTWVTHCSYQSVFVSVCVRDCHCVLADTTDTYRVLHRAVWTRMAVAFTHTFQHSLLDSLWCLTSVCNCLCPFSIMYVIYAVYT